MSRPRGSDGIDALVFVTLAVVYLHTLAGTFTIGRRLLAGTDLSGTERALAVDCGRGAVTVLLAQHLPSGRMDGVDLWRSQDQSANAEERTRANLVASQVSERVVLHTADMRRLPFEDNSFDVLTAGVSIHNLKDSAGRSRRGCRRRRFSGWWSAPWMATTTLFGTKA